MRPQRIMSFGEGAGGSTQRRRMAATCGGGASATASDEGGSGLLFEACHEALAQLEVLRIILEYVEEGRFCFVAGVSTQWRASYTALYPGAETSFSSVVSSVECLNWATSQQGLELSAKLFKAAARHGDVEVCEALHGKDCPWDEHVCNATARNSKHGLRVLKWLRSEDFLDKEQCPWYTDGSIMCVEAAGTGHLEMLKWLMSEGHVPFDFECWYDACKNGHVPVVEWLLEHSPTRALLEEDRFGRSCSGVLYAAGGGHLEVLQLLHANARHLCDWDADLCSVAAREGKSLAVLKWLRSDEVQCEWDKKSCPQSSWTEEEEEGDINAKTFEEIKQWVHANGHPCDCQD